MHDAVDYCVSVENRLLCGTSGGRAGISAALSGAHVVQDRHIYRSTWRRDAAVLFPAWRDDLALVHDRKRRRGRGWLHGPRRNGRAASDTRKNEMPYQALVQADCECLAADKDAVVAPFPAVRSVSRLPAALLLRASPADRADLRLQSFPHYRSSLVSLAGGNEPAFGQPPFDADAGIPRSHARRPADQHRPDRQLDAAGRALSATAADVSK